MKYLYAIPLILALIACGEDSNKYAASSASSPFGAPVVAQQPQTQAGQPVIINNQPPVQQNSGIQDMLIGGAIGYMLGNSGSRAPAVAPAPQIVERRIYTERVREVPVTPAKPQVPSNVNPNIAKPAVPATITRVDPPKAAPSYTPRSFSSPSRIGGRR